MGRLGGAARAFSYTWGVRRVISAVYDDFPFDLVHAHTALLDGTAALAIKEAIGVPVVLTEHTGPFGVLTKTSAMRRLVRRALAECDRVLAVSHCLKEAIHEVFPDLPRSIEVVPNGVDESIFHPRPLERNPSDSVTVLWIGFFDALKRPLLALSAFSAAAQRMPSLRLRMIGIGPLEGDLRCAVSQKKLSDRVHIESYMDREALALALAKAHVLLVTSTLETFSLVTAEALSTGIPVVSTRCGGPEELIAESWMGRLADDNAEALSHALVDVAGTLSEFSAEQLHAHATNRFGMHAVVARLRAIYCDVLSGRTNILVAGNK
jgi:glycosyltransferase involved in cell wall biosynthesis